MFAASQKPSFSTTIAESRRVDRSKKVEFGGAPGLPAGCKTLLSFLCLDSTSGDRLANALGVRGSIPGTSWSLVLRKSAEANSVHMHDWTQQPLQRMQDRACAYRPTEASTLPLSRLSRSLLRFMSSQASITPIRQSRHHCHPSKHHC